MDNFWDSTYIKRLILSLMIGILLIMCSIQKYSEWSKCVAPFGFWNLVNSFYITFALYLILPFPLINFIV